MLMRRKKNVLVWEKIITKENASCKNIFDFRDEKKTKQIKLLLLKTDKEKVRQRIKTFSVIKMRMLVQKNYYALSLTPP